MGFFKTYSEKEVKRVMPLVKKINELESEIAKLTDKIKESKRKNKIVNTEFLNMNQKNIVQKELNRLKEKNYILVQMKYMINIEK